MKSSKILSIEKIKCPLERYDLTVEGLHRYFANGILVHNTDGQNLAVTYKDGEVKAARNKETLKNPMTISEVEKKFEGRGEIEKAFTTSMRDISKAISSLSDKELKEIFNDGQNFMAFEIIYPPTKNVVDYGNRCLIQLHGVNIYNDKFEKVSEDKEAADKLYKLLKKHNALNQETFEITNHTKLKLKDAKDAEDALADVLSKLEKIQGKLPDETTIAQYIDVRYRRKIRKTMKEANIDAATHKEFVKSLAKRLSYVEDGKVSKNDLKAIAKKEGMDVSSSEFKSFVSKMEANQPDDNQTLIMPIEMLVVDAGMQLMKNLTGFISADKSKSAQILTKELEDTLKKLESEKENLSPSGKKAFEKNLKKLKQFGKESTGVEGIVFLYNDKVYKMTGNFGAINQLLGIMKF